MLALGHRLRRSLAGVLLATVAIANAGCAGGGGAGEPAGSDLPHLAIEVLPPVARVGGMEISYRVQQENSHPFDVVGVAYSLRGPDGPFWDATEDVGASSEGRGPLASSPGGLVHRFRWKCYYDRDRAPSQGNSGTHYPYKAVVLLRIRDRSSGEEVETRSEEFSLDYDSWDVLAGRMGE